MKKLHPTTQYKKDYKRFRNNPRKLQKLILHILSVSALIRVMDLYAVAKRRV